MAQIHSIQTGQQAVTSGSGTTVNVTITAVTLAQSVVMFTFRSVNSNENRIRREMWTGQLTSTTNIQFVRDQSSFAQNGTIEWTVLEWDSSVTVHRGSASPTTASSSTSIGATINTGSSFPVTTFRTDQNNMGNSEIGRTSLSSTNITFDFDAAPGTGDAEIEWQIVEFDSADADVQSGTIVVAASTASNTATITSVTTGDTFIAHGGLETSNSSSGIHRNKCILELTNATTVTATRTLRGSAAAQTVQYYVVEMLDGSSVESGTTTISATNTTPTQPTFTAMTNPSAINTHYIQNDRNTDTAADHFIGDNYVTVEINGSDDGVNLERGATDGATETAWFAVDWNAAAAGVAVDATTGNLNIVGQDASVQVDIAATATLGNLNIAGQGSSVNLAKNITATIGTLEIAGSNAAVSIDRDVSATLGTIEIAGLGAGVSLDRTANATAGSLEIASNNASVGIGLSVNATLGTLTINGQGASVTVDITTTATLGTIEIGGVNASVQVGNNIVANAGVGALEIAGLNADVEALVDVNVSATLGILEINGINATVLTGTGIQVTATTGNLSISGLNSVVIHDAASYVDEFVGLGTLMYSKGEEYFVLNPGTDLSGVVSELEEQTANQATALEQNYINQKELEEIKRQLRLLNARSEEAFDTKIDEDDIK